MMSNICKHPQKNLSKPNAAIHQKDLISWPSVFILKTKGWLNI